MSTGRTAVIEGGRHLARSGLSGSTTGNVSVRNDDGVFISASGVILGSMTEDDVSLIDLECTLLAGRKPSKESTLHVAMYQKNPAHTAVVHLHSPHAVAVSCLEPWAAHSAIPPLTPYLIMRVGQVPLLPFHPPGSPELGEDVRRLELPFHGALMANHGLIVSSVTMAGAMEAAAEIEEACRVTLATEGRDRRLIDPDSILNMSRQASTPWTPTSASSSQ